MSVHQHLIKIDYLKNLVPSTYHILVPIAHHIFLYISKQFLIHIKAISINFWQTVE